MTIDKNKIIKEIIKEAKGVEEKLTRCGTVTALNGNLYSIQFLDETLYMEKDEAPEVDELIGNEIVFKAKEIKGKKLFVSYKEVFREYEKCMEGKITLRGTVVAVDGDPLNFTNDVMILKHHDDLLYLPRTEFGLIYPSKLLNAYIGKDINFRVKEIKDGRVIISTRLIAEEKRDKLIERLQAGEQIEGTIIKFDNWGAMLNYDTVPLILKNKDFNEGTFTKINQVKQLNEKVLVKLVRVSPTKRIEVEAVNKYKDAITFDVNKLEKNMIIKGIVTNVLPFGAFINIAQGIDVLCPIPDVTSDLRPPKEWDEVTIRITTASMENGRPKVRGRIYSYLTGVDEQSAISPENLKKAKEEEDVR